MLLPLLLSLAAAPQDCTQDARVYLLAGQSNMVGFLTLEQYLPPELAVPQPDVALWDGTAAVPSWQHLAPGAGLAFGPELSLGRALADAAPEDRIYLIKYAANGTALHDDWAPPLGPQWLTFLATAQAALADLTQQGVRYELGGVFWMQGESDAAEGMGAAYASNLTSFIQTVRQRLGEPKLPFVLGRILVGWGDLPNNTAVRQAQVHVAGATQAVSWLDTDGISAVGGHYDADGQVELGERFAAAWYGLQDVGTWTNLGQGLATGGSAPVLAGQGVLWPCSPTNLAVAGGPPGATGLLAYGLAATPQPFLGGTLVPDVAAPGGWLPLLVDQTGAATLQWSWPPGLPPGLTLILQGWLTDPVTGRISATNALEAQAP